MHWCARLCCCQIACQCLVSVLSWVVSNWPIHKRAIIWKLIGHVVNYCLVWCHEFMIFKNSCSLRTMWYSCPSDKQSCWNLICNGDCLPVSVFHSIQHVRPSGFRKHMSATPGTTPIALFIAPLMPFTLLLLMAKTLPRKSGREFQRFVKAFAWAFTSLISTSV